MSKKEINNIDVFADVISSLTASAAAGIDGIQILKMDTLSRKSKKSKNIVVNFLPSDKVSIDIIVGVEYGYVVPDVVSLVQEKVIKAVESATKFKVSSVNIHVSEIIVNS